jgi:hypothetical protein
MTANAKTTTPDPNRVTGPAGVRLLVPRAGGWCIQRESGPRDDDPFEETREEALSWARELVNAKGTTFPPHAQPSPNERPDALASTRPPRPPPPPEVIRARPLKPGVIGRYEYSSEDKPLRSRR